MKKNGYFKKYVTNNIDIEETTAYLSPRRLSSHGDACRRVPLRVLIKWGENTRSQVRDPFSF